MGSNQEKTHSRNLRNFEAETFGTFGVNLGNALGRGELGAGRRHHGGHHLGHPGLKALLEVVGSLKIHQKDWARFLIVKIHKMTSISIGTCRKKFHQMSSLFRMF